MAKYLTATVVAYNDSIPTVILAGAELPEWAEGKVGDHVLTDAAPIAAPEVDPEPESVDYNKLTVAQLDALLDERGIEVEGIKADKVAALQEHDTE